MKIKLEIEGSAGVGVLRGPRPRTVSEGKLDADSGVGGRWRVERVLEGGARSLLCLGGAWSWAHEGSMKRVSRQSPVLYFSISYEDTRFPCRVVRNDLKEYDNSRCRKVLLRSAAGMLMSKLSFTKKTTMK